MLGMGEPLSNPKVFDALEILTHPKLIGMSARKISISTLGILPGIKKLNNHYPQVTERKKARKKVFFLSSRMYLHSPSLSTCVGI